MANVRFVNVKVNSMFEFFNLFIIVFLQISGPFAVVFGGLKISEYLEGGFKALFLTVWCVFWLSLIIAWGSVHG